jgi:hypothetical protein
VLVASKEFPRLQLLTYRVFQGNFKARILSTNFAASVMIRVVGALQTLGTQDEGGAMLAIIAAVLVVLWLLGFTAFHVTSGFIHLLLILAVISLVMHFFRGRTTVA